MNIQTIGNKAIRSRFHLRMMNFLLPFVVPFNRPHRFRIVELQADKIKIKIPYIRRNLNHIRGIHACALATASEMSTGMLLLLILGNDRYRIIMRRLEMDYHYQAKMDAYATFTLSKQWLDEKILAPLKENNVVETSCEVNIYDRNENHISTGKVFWQLKEWTKVKTKV